MKMSIRKMLCAALAALGCSSGAMAQGNVVIAELYGAGGNTGATFTNDYVVLFNRSSSSQAIGGWSIQYAGQAGSSWSKVDITAGVTLNPGQAYLIQLASGTNGGPLTLPPDQTSNTINMSGTNGKLALMRNNTAIGTVGCPVTDVSVSVNLEDFVQYGVAGMTNVCGEGGAPTGVSTSAITAAKRNGNGCVDTNNNANDFTVGAPNLRNLASTLTPCVAGGACCTGLTCTVVSSAPACNGTYQGDGSSCAPLNPCLPPQGSCCVAANTTCTQTDQSTCTGQGGVWVLAGVCSPTTCSGACCTGATCTLTSAPGCANGTYTAGATCGPTSCPVELPVQVGDIAYGASVSSLADSMPQVRGGNRVATWSRFNFVQSPRFDNANGGSHNPQGNLLGLNFGTSAGGAVLTNLSTNGTGNGQTLFTLDGTQFGLALTRASGLSVSPDNTKVALVGSDSARVVVLNYNAGASVGTGSGATITGGNQTDPVTFTFASGQSSGTAWLDNSTLIAHVNSADLFTLGPAIFTIPVDSAGVLGTPQFRLNTTSTGFTGASRFYAIAYNPLISNFIYALLSDFNTSTAVSTTRLSVIDPATWTEVKSIALSTSLETGREIAIGADRNLYISQFAGSTFVSATSALIDRLNLDVNGNGTIELSDINALADNSSVNYYLRRETPAPAQVTSSFNGLDIAVSTGTVTPTGACCVAGGGCTVTTAVACIGGTYQGNGTNCSPNPCPQPSVGRCCVGSRCVTGVADAAACAALIGGTVAGSDFTAGGTNCNIILPPINSTSPCCLADYNKVGGVAVQDIFDFLNGWFGNSANADINGGGLGVNDIFDFLTAWFAGGC
jgi:Lamin Tail Domain